MFTIDDALLRRVTGLAAGRVYSVLFDDIDHGPTWDRAGRIKSTASQSSVGPVAQIKESGIRIAWQPSKL